MKTINCAECNVEYKYEPAKGYPDKRKYCANCSEKKKQSWESKSEPTTANETVTHQAQAEAEAENVPMNPEMDWNKPKKSYELTDGNIRIGALTCAIAWKENIPDLQSLWNTVKDFEEYIRNGK